MHRFPSSLSLRLDWSELDLYGHINNVAFFKYLQASRINYLEQVGLGALSADGPGPIIAATECRFLQPLHYPGSIVVKASVSFIRHTSFGITHHIYNDAGGLAAEGRDVVVLYHHGTQQKMQITDALRKQIELLEQRDFPIMPEEQ